MVSPFLEGAAPLVSGAKQDEILFTFPSAALPSLLLVLPGLPLSFSSGLEWLSLGSSSLFSLLLPAKEERGVG